MRTTLLCGLLLLAACDRHTVTPAALCAEYRLVQEHHLTYYFVKSDQHRPALTVDTLNPWRACGDDLDYAEAFYRAEVITYRSHGHVVKIDSTYQHFIKTSE